MAKHTITADEARTFDPSAQRVTDLGGNATQTESGAYIDVNSIDNRPSQSRTDMPEPLKR